MSEPFFVTLHHHPKGTISRPPYFITIPRNQIQQVCWHDCYLIVDVKNSNGGYTYRVHEEQVNPRAGYPIPPRDLSRLDPWIMSVNRCEWGERTPGRLAFDEWHLACEVTPYDGMTQEEWDEKILPFSPYLENMGTLTASFEHNSATNLYVEGAGNVGTSIHVREFINLVMILTKTGG